MRSGCTRPIPGINVRPHRKHEKVRCSGGGGGLFVIVVVSRAYQVACSGAAQSYNVSSPYHRKNTQSTIAVSVLPEAWQSIQTAVSVGELTVIQKTLVYRQEYLYFKDPGVK